MVYGNAIGALYDAETLAVKPRITDLIVWLFPQNYRLINGNLPASSWTANSDDALNYKDGVECLGRHQNIEYRD